MKEVTDIDIARKYLNISNSASERQIPFTLSLKKIKELLSENSCYYSGVEFTSEGDDAKTFDRVDSTKGYTDNNVVVCTSKINKRKHDLTLEEIESLYDGITKYKEKISKLKTKNEAWVHIDKYENYLLSSTAKIKNTITNKFLSIQKGKVKLSNAEGRKYVNVNHLLKQYFVDLEDKFEIRQIKKPLNHENGTRIFRDKVNNEYALYKENVHQYMVYKIIDSKVFTNNIYKYKKDRLVFYEKRTLKFD